MGSTIIFGIGVIIGSIITQIIFRAFLVGTLRVDTSDPTDNPYMFLEASKSLDTIARKKYITLKVDIKNYIPHK